MSEWWTYRPADFLMFSARTWGRLLASWNRELWPWQWALLLGAVGLVGAAARWPRGSARWVAIVLALAWAWVAWAFLWRRFAPINTGAPWSALAFALQAALLLVLGTGRIGAAVPITLHRGGLVAALAAIVLYPLAAPLTGRGWAQAEVAGAMPGPTALLTVGLLLALPLRRRAWLLVIPAVALVVGWWADWLLWAG